MFSFFLQSKKKIVMFISIAMSFVTAKKCGVLVFFFAEFKIVFLCGGNYFFFFFFILVPAPDLFFTLTSLFFFFF
jgi:hypothetical protein